MKHNSNIEVENMPVLKVGDIVTRKSYNGDIYFKITDVRYNNNGIPVYGLRGLLYRLHADSTIDDLLPVNSQAAYLNTRQNVIKARNHAFLNKGRFRIPFFQMFKPKSCKVLHFDADEEFLKTCISHYKLSKIDAVGLLYSESQQPNVVRGFLEKYNPDIVVFTGHDGIKKDSGDLSSLNNYSNSKYFVKSVKEARIYQPDFEKLCIFAGACQSYFEVIMDAGANFASSPGRILINALDPAIVSEKIALTDSRFIVTPREVAKITISGSKGIGGINTRGRMKKV